MMHKTGVANLPLHGGHAPRWLFARMVRLAKAVTDAVVEEYGSEEFLRRISNPCWFQAFSCVLGFDWHSSGTTTTTCGALKVALDPQETGIYVAGGKGATSRKTPEEIVEAGDLFNLKTDEVDDMVYSSKITAKVDNSCIQDSYQLYHHVFFLTEEGDWAVVQQGMGDRYARRYHWLSAETRCFFEEPHTGICCDHMKEGVLDMASKESDEARSISVDLVNDGPQHLGKYFMGKGGQRKLSQFTMPSHHPVLDMDLGRDGLRVLQKAYELQPENYEELVSLRGMGPKKIRALALISDLVYGSEPSWKDPVKYSFTHGGKDGFPYPVNRGVYDTSIETLRDALEQARLDRRERIHAIKRLKDFIKE
ncbi:MAG: hypothetical protein B6U72_02480 [Candidatus Altiarchaeales archaeon ex4484_2]|nr:MAG: hypothetical protein B6U72_02480 [Candidatus Altiarchaeales archaeon ex4484_2]